MPRSKDDARRQPAARGDQDSNTNTQDLPHETPTMGLLHPHGTTSGGQSDAITDEGLGLSPGRAPTDDEIRGSGLVDDQELTADFEPTGQRSGSLADALVRSGQAEVIDDEPDLTTSPHLLDGADAAIPDLEPSLMDQEILTDPLGAAGDTDDPSTNEIDPVADGDEVYVPPVDPVIITDRPGEARVLGGFAFSAEEQIVPKRSASDGQIGDEAIADAVRSALRHDAATTDLDIEVTVEQGIVRLRGTVPGMEDVDNAEAVASRVEAVRDVAEELDVAGL
jgi:hypothetical protein